MVLLLEAIICNVGRCPSDWIVLVMRNIALCLFGSPGARGRALSMVPLLGGRRCVGKRKKRLSSRGYS